MRRLRQTPLSSWVLLTNNQFRRYVYLRSVAIAQVKSAIDAGLLPKLFKWRSGISAGFMNSHFARKPLGIKCTDCEALALSYDHRDYLLPLKVEPVCLSCNARRGPAWPTVLWLMSQPKSFCRNPLSVFKRKLEELFEKRSG
jgi:hypothetical protein